MKILKVSSILRWSFLLLFLVTTSAYAVSDDTPINELPVGSKLVALKTMPLFDVSYAKKYKRINFFEGKALTKTHSELGSSHSIYCQLLLPDNYGYTLKKGFIFNIDTKAILGPLYVNDTTRQAPGIYWGNDPGFYCFNSNKGKTPTYGELKAAIKGHLRFLLPSEHFGSHDLTAPPEGGFYASPNSSDSILKINPRTRAVLLSDLVIEAGDNQIRFSNGKILNRNHLYSEDSKDTVYCYLWPKKVSRQRRVISKHLEREASTEPSGLVYLKLGEPQFSNEYSAVIPINRSKNFKALVCNRKNTKDVSIAEMKASLAGFIEINEPTPQNIMCYEKYCMDDITCQF